MQMMRNDGNESMLLGELIPDVPASIAACMVSGISSDSRLVERGFIFAALIGHSDDGNQYITDAVENGASVVLCEREESKSFGDKQKHDIIFLVVPDLREKLSSIAARFYGQPTHFQHVIGVTGTNGKTTCTQLITKAIRQLGEPCGVMGTLGSNAHDDDVEMTHATTPDPIFVQKEFAKWLRQGVKIGVMEVSSHGLVQHRVADVDFDAAIFTNLSRDHLDYHGSMQAYGESKLSLFSFDSLSAVIVNADDTFSSTIEDNLAAGVRCIRYGVKDSRAQVLASSIEYSKQGIRYYLQTPWGDGWLSSGLLGEFNVYNLLAVVCALFDKGYDFDSVINVIAKLPAVEGRMQSVSAEGCDINVVVDFAHTPDALMQALRASRVHTQGKLWCVFGCGGDRDAGKRSLMGAVAEQHADHLVITSDNPRSEAPQAIIDDVLIGINGESTVILERDLAIAHAIENAVPGDWVLIAGKGHESYQEVDGCRIPFDDAKYARALLSEYRSVTDASSIIKEKKR